MFEVYPGVQLHGLLGNSMPLGYWARVPIGLAGWLVGAGLERWLTEPEKDRIGEWVRSCAK